MAWTDTRVETLTTLWQAGYSGSLIGIELGLTRSAVIGKAQRLRLPGRTTLVTRRPQRSQQVLAPKRPPKPKKASPSRRRSITPETKPRPKAALPELGPAPEVPVTVLTLTQANCNWPEGDPKRLGFHFCGRKPPNRPYCPHHAARAYR